MIARAWAWMRRAYDSWQGWAYDHIPPGLRLGLGLLLIAAGFVGFLPVLGFWMIPAGLAIAALDVRLLWRKLRGRS